MTTADSATEWWLMRGSAAHGPFTPAYIQLSLRSGAIAPEVLACPVGGQQWKPLNAWPEFNSAMSSQPVSSSGGSKAELPEFAKWIRSYCLFVSPMLFFGGMLGCLNAGSSFVPESPLFGVELIALAIYGIVQLGVAAILILGAIDLPTRSTKAVRMLQLGFALDLLNVVAMLVVTLFLFALAFSEQGHIAEVRDSVFDLLAPVQLAAVAFEAVALVWLVLKFESITRPGSV